MKTSTPPFLTLPPELLHCIISELDSIDDLISLDLTCQSLHRVLASSGHALQDFASRHIRCFDEALRITRAKLLPLSLYQSLCHFDLTTNTYTQPPEASFFHNLSTDPPSVSEVSKSRRLYEVANAWEGDRTRARADSLQCKEWRNLQSDWTPLFNVRQEDYRDTFFRAAFKQMLFGVVYSQAHLNPRRIIEAKFGLHGHEKTLPPLVLRAIRTMRAKKEEKELRCYPPFHQDNRKWRDEMMVVLCSGFWKWVTEDCKRRADVGKGVTREPGEKWMNSLTLTAGEWAILAEAMEMYCISFDRLCYVRKERLVNPPPSKDPWGETKTSSSARNVLCPADQITAHLKDVEGGKSTCSVIKLYLYGGTSEQFYIVTPRANESRVSQLLGDNERIINSWEFSVIRAALKENLGLKIDYMGTMTLCGIFSDPSGWDWNVYDWVPHRRDLRWWEFGIARQTIWTIIPADVHTTRP